jgi:Protein of unknown function (DUF1168)
MPRYTSTQVFTDTNTKIVSSGSYGGDNSNKKVKVEKVDNVMGSTAGAGSGEFDLYRSARRREITRLESMDKADKEEAERRLFAEKVERNRREADERTAKNASKRKRKREKRKTEQMQKGEHIGGDGDNQSSIADDGEDRE